MAMEAVVKHVVRSRWQQASAPVEVRKPLPKPAGRDVCRYILSTRSRSQLLERSRPVYLVRADGIEPTRPAWKAGVLPLNYARVAQERRDSSMRVSGQARNIVLPISRICREIGFSPGFYPVSDCERRFCAVVWNVWHSSLRRLPPRFKMPVRPLRKRPSM